MAEVTEVVKEANQDISISGALIGSNGNKYGTSMNMNVDFGTDLPGS
jgi:hypothetical protein